MGRLEKFKEYRRNRRRMLFVILLFITIVFSGICAVDYSVNDLMNNQRGLSIVTFKNMESYYEISVMNQKIYIHTERIRKDFAKFKELIGFR